MSEDTVSDEQIIRKKLCDLAIDQFRFMVDKDDINEVEIMRPDRNSRGCFIGPLAVIPVNVTVDNDEGDEVLDLTGDYGLILYAVAALPFFAELVVWINSELDQIADSPIPPQFIRGLQKKAKWLQELVDDRDLTIGEGTHGFMKFPEKDE